LLRQINGHLQRRHWLFDRQIYWRSVSGLSGIKAWRDKAVVGLPVPSSSASSQQLFWQGVLSNVLNPKIAIFFLAFLPQFVDKEGNGVTLQLIMLGLTFAILGLMFLLVVGYSSGTIGRWITHRRSMPSPGTFIWWYPDCAVCVWLSRETVTAKISPTENSKDKS
jgi:hypothetical protein